MEITILIIALLTLLLVLGSVLLNVLITERVRSVDTISAKVGELEGYMEEILGLLTNPQNDTMDVFTSVDGKYSGRSLEELIQNISKGEGFNYDPNDPEALRKFIERFMNNQDDEEDDEDGPPWKP